MMIYMPNHGAQILDLNPFDDGPSEYSQDTEDTEYTPIQMPDDNRPPSPGSSKNSGGAQCNKPLNQIKITKTM